MGSNTYDEGVEGLHRLVEKVALARETLGDDVDLMLNPVMSFNVEYALRVFEPLQPFRLRWIEEPLMPHDTEGLEILKRAFPKQPIATGEDHHGRHAFRASWRDAALTSCSPTCAGPAA